MSLNLLKVGEKAKVVSINAIPKIKQHLTELGFTSGRNIEITQYSFGKNLIVALAGGRMALDSKMAHRIDVILDNKKNEDM